MLERGRQNALLLWLTAAAGAVLLLVVVFLVFDTSGSDDADDVSQGTGNGGALPGELPGDAFPPVYPGDGEPSGAGAPCQPGQSDRISWADAGNNLNTKVAMIGPVAEVQDDGSQLVVGYEQGDADEVVLVLTDNLLNRIPGSAEELYADQTVCAIGVIQRVEGRLQMVINAPAELAVF